MTDPIIQEKLSRLRNGEATRELQDSLTEMDVSGNKAGRTVDQQQTPLFLDRGGYRGGCVTA